MKWLTIIGTALSVGLLLLRYYLSPTKVKERALKDNAKAQKQWKIAYEAGKYFKKEGDKKKGRRYLSRARRAYITAMRDA